MLGVGSSPYGGPTFHWEFQPRVELMLLPPPLPITATRAALPASVLGSVPRWLALVTTWGLKSRLQIATVSPAALADWEPAEMRLGPLTGKEVDEMRTWITHDITKPTALHGD